MTICITFILKRIIDKATITELELSESNNTFFFWRLEIYSCDGKFPPFTISYSNTHIDSIFLFVSKYPSVWQEFFLVTRSGIFFLWQEVSSCNRNFSGFSFGVIRGRPKRKLTSSNQEPTRNKVPASSSWFWCFWRSWFGYWIYKISIFLGEPGSSGLITSQTRKFWVWQRSSWCDQDVLGLKHALLNWNQT